MVFLNSDLYTVMILFFILAGVSIYALIQSKKNYLILFFLTPLLLVSTLYSAKIVYSLLGSPIRGFPVENVDVIWVYPLDPYIYFTATDMDKKGAEPKYYRIAYNEENQKMMTKLKQKISMGQKTTGKFKKSQGESKSEEYEKYFFEPLGQEGPMKEYELNIEKTSWESMEDNPQVPPQFQNKIRNPHMNPHVRNGTEGTQVELDDPTLYGFGP